MTDLANQFMRSHFGLGSSTRGMTMDEANKGRTEAEAREACRRPFEPDEYWINVFWNRKWGRIDLPCGEGGEKSVGVGDGKASKSLT